LSAPHNLAEVLLSKQTASMISDTFVGQDHGTLYHLIQKDLWEQSKQSGKPYFPPTYEAVSGTAATHS
jgi:hypothetical protein